MAWASQGSRSWYDYGFPIYQKRQAPDVVQTELAFTTDHP